MLKVLAVEDNLLAGSMVSVFFKKAHADVQVDIVETGYDAREKINETNNAYDIIMMDFGLPDCTGIQLTKDLRDMGVESMIIALTGNLDEYTEEEREAAGLNGGYHKPFSIALALEVIQMYNEFRKNS